MAKRPKYVLASLALVALVAASTCAATDDDVAVVQVAGREALVYAPLSPTHEPRALVLVLHGGGGNARRIASRTAEGGLNLNAVAARDGFVVAYLNGTPVTRRLGADVLGWNAGACCGVPAASRVDDVAWFANAIDALAARYGLDRTRVYAIGHSNGAMMAQRLMCETALLAGEVAISGPLETDADACPAARGKRVLAIHGADDRNVPVTGGRGTAGMSGVAFRSEADSERAFVRGGARYELIELDGADHRLDRLEAALQRTEGLSIAEKATRWFGLGPASER